MKTTFSAAYLIQKLFLSVFIVLLSTGYVFAAVGGSTIGGCIYTGHGTVTYTLNAVGEAIPNYTTDYAPSANTPPISDAQVSIQSQGDGSVVAYGTMGIGGANCWEATIPDAVSNTTGLPGADGTPDVTDLVVMFSAPGHDSTSREFTWDDGRFGSAGNFVHPTGPHIEAGGTGTESVWATGGQDAYLPPLTVDTTGDGRANTMELANLLHYVFYDEFTNGNDNGALIEKPLKGVEVCVWDEEGDINNKATAVQCKLTGAETAFTTIDGMVFGPGGTDPTGYVYFRDLPPGEYRVKSDASPVTQADNPFLHMSDANRAAATPSWFQTYTEEAGHSLEVSLKPGDPGTFFGGYLTWHAFIENLGSDAGGNPAISGSIIGSFMDADAPEPLPQVNGGRVPPTNARYENGVAWDINNNIQACTLPGGICPPGWDTFGPSRQDVMPNGAIPDGVVALYTIGDFPQLVAVVQLTQPASFNEPIGASFAITNVPAGQYEMFAFDAPLVNVPTVGVQVTVTAGNQANVGNILVPRFGARTMGFVMNNGAPVPGATVKTTYKLGDTKHAVTTNANGWFYNDFHPETEALGNIYVDIPDGASFRGKIITEDFQQIQAEGIGLLNPPVITTATHNAMNRLIQWSTLNYFVDLQVESIPADVGNVMGGVFYDQLAMGSWVGNNVWDEDEEILQQGVTVNLVDATTGAIVATTTTGKADKADAQKLGWVPAATMPVNEVGSVTAGPVTCSGCSQTTGTPGPMPGFYEFRDVAPGTYRIEAVPPAGSTTPYGKFYASINGNGTGIAGIAGTVRDEDILFFDGSNFHMFFDGSLAGLPGDADIDALHVVDHDTFYVSFAGAGTAQTVNIPAGITSPAFVADDEDVVLYDAGNWSLYFDGSAYGLGDLSGEDVDALAFLPDGRMVISTRGSANAGAASNVTPLVVSSTTGWTGTNPRPQDEDLLVFDGTGFDMYLDASDSNIVLNGSNEEDVMGASVAPNGDIYLTTLAAFASDIGVSGDGSDIFVCHAPVTGTVSSCGSGELFFNGVSAGLENLTATSYHESLDAISLAGLGLADTVVVTGGQNRRIDLATSTVNAAGGATFGVPLAGELEGGTFSGMGDLDPNPTSNWFDEATALKGTAMAMYDHNNYFLGVMFNGDPWCNWMNNAIYQPGTGGMSCSTSHPDYLAQSAEAERRFAPGVHRVNGNDPAFPLSNVPAYQGGPLLSSFYTNYDAMELNYTFGQGNFKSEAAWTPLVAQASLPVVNFCVTNIATTAIDNGGGSWGAVATVTVQDEAGFAVAGAVVDGTWTPTGGGATSSCIAAGNPTSSCSMSVQTVEPPSSLQTVFDITNVTGPTTGVNWVYNAALPGCVTTATVASPVAQAPGAVVVAPYSVNLVEKWEAHLSITGTAAQTDWSIDGSEIKTTGIPADVMWVVETGACSVPYSVAGGTITGTVNAPAGFGGVCP